MGTRQAITNIVFDLPLLRVSDLIAALDRHIEYRAASGHAWVYQSRLAWFLRWLRLTHPTEGALLGPADFVEFRTWLNVIRSKRQDKPLGYELQGEILRRLRTALRWAFLEGRLVHDYASWVPAINHGVVEPIFSFDDDDVEMEGDEAKIVVAELTGAGHISTTEARGWLEIFLNAKRFRGLSDSTLHDYHARIEAYLAFVAAHDNLQPFQPSAIERYIAHRTATVSAHSVYGDYRTLAVFVNWLVKRGYIAAGQSPLEEIETPRLPRKRMRHIDLSQFQRLYASIRGDGWLDRRDRMIFVILFFSGLRAGEVLGLRSADIERGDGCIYVRKGKGDRDRIVPFHPDLPWLVDAYLVARPPFEDTDTLLVSSDGASGIRGPMHYEGLKVMLRRRCKVSGLPLFNLHSFRHGFAMTFLNHGLELSALARSMGHASTSTTEGYARWETSGLRAAYLAVLARFAGSVAIC